MLKIKVTDLGKSWGGTWTHLSAKHTWGGLVIYAAEKELPSDPLRKGKVKQRELCRKSSACPSQICLIIKLGVLLLKCIDSQALLWTYWFRLSGRAPESFKKIPPMGPSVLGFLKHNFEIMGHNPEHFWEEEPPQSQIWGGRIPACFGDRHLINDLQSG